MASPATKRAFGTHFSKPERQQWTTDALFMIGACAAFVSYLINKSRNAGLLASKRTAQ